MIYIFGKGAHSNGRNTCLVMDSGITPEGTYIFPVKVDLAVLDATEDPVNYTIPMTLITSMPI